MDSLSAALSTTLQGEGATLALGAAIARHCREGDVIALCGPLGAGKTTFTRGLALGLGLDPSASVRSPTFTLCNEYAARLHLLHLDLYRLEQQEEAQQLGFGDRVGSEGVSVVEWADRFPALLPAHSLWLVLEHLQESRKVTVFEGDGRDLDWVAELPGTAETDGFTWTATRAAPPWALSCSPWL